MNRLAVGIGNEFNSPWGKSQGFGGLVSVIVSNAIFIAAIILLFMVVGGGIMMISICSQRQTSGNSRIYWVYNNICKLLVNQSSRSGNRVKHFGVATLKTWIKLLNLAQLTLHPE